MPKGTLYDSNLRDRPTRGGTLDPNTGKVTQFWDDGYRYSHGDYDRGGHWTNSNIDRGDPGRHDPPPDAK